MRTEAHVSVVKAKVRTAELARHAVSKSEAGRVVVITTAMGLPRLWSYVTPVVHEGFLAGLGGQRRETPAARLEAAVQEARTRLVRRCEGLIERQVPDVTLVALLLDHGELHVVSAGPSRAYVHRKGDARRLTPRED